MSRCSLTLPSKTKMTASIQLIVLDRLVELRENIPNEKVLQELVMDILRVLSATDYEVRKKTLHLALDLVSSRNVQEMVMFLKKVRFARTSLGHYVDS